MLRDKARIGTDKELKKLEKHLTKLYTQAGKDLTEKHRKYFEKFTAQDEAKRKLVEQGRLSKTAYRKWRQGKIMMGKHWETMKEQAAVDLYNVNHIATEYINNRIPDIYSMCYNFSAKDIEAGVSNRISFEMANAGALRRLAMSEGKSFLPEKELDPEKDIPWNMKLINDEVFQGIYQGESIPKISKRLMNVGVKNEKSAVRAARTIVNQVENQARQDVAERAQEMGVIMKKVWHTISDHRTRDWHKQAGYDYGSRDKAIPIDEPFIVGGEKLMRPGDPSLGASPANLYNCRCASANIPAGFKSILPPDKQGKIKVRFDYGGT